MTSKSPNKINKDIQTLKNNSILKYSLQLIVKNLLSEFHAKNYDGNKFMKVILERVRSETQSSQKQDVLDIWPEIQVFTWNLAICPKYWVMMFENEEFFSSQSESIDMHVFTNKIYKYVVGQGQRLTQLGDLMGELVSEYLFMFFQQISSQICESYQKGRQIIMNETKYLEQHVKQSKIINFYFIYKLLLEISQNCSEKIIDHLSTSIFRNIQAYYSQSFAEYIIEKHQVLSLIFDQNSNKKYSEEQPLIDIIERVKKSKNVTWREAIREDGESAIIVQFGPQSKEEIPSENYMIKMDNKGKIKVLNCNNLRKKWMVTDAAQKNYDILKVVSDKGHLAKKLRNAPTSLKDVSMNDHFSTVGGSLGKCLADIRKYDSFGDFVFDFSKKSILSGTFNYVARNIPLIGILFATGGYSYTLFGILSNKNVNKSKKFQQMGYITFDIASSIGTGLLGAAIGQTLIPMPVVGAFVGGLVGSFIGQIGGKAITNKLESLRFKKIIESLEATIKPGGYWQLKSSQKDLLKVIGVNREHFYQTIPEQIEGRLGCDKLWFAMIAFTILSFNESKKRAEFIKMKLDVIKKQKKQLSVQDLKKQLHFEASMDLVCVMKYFEINKVSLISCFEELEDFVTDIFSLME